MPSPGSRGREGLLPAFQRHHLGEQRLEVDGPPLEQVERSAPTKDGVARKARSDRQLVETDVGRRGSSTGLPREADHLRSGRRARADSRRERHLRPRWPEHSTTRSASSGAVLRGCLVAKPRLPAASRRARSRGVPRTCTVACPVARATCAASRPIVPGPVYEHSSPSRRLALLQQRVAVRRKRLGHRRDAGRRASRGCGAGSVTGTTKPRREGAVHVRADRAPLRAQVRHASARQNAQWPQVE